MIHEISDGMIDKIPDRTIDKITEITIDKHIVKGFAYKQPLRFANLRFLASWLQYDDDEDDDNDS